MEGGTHAFLGRLTAEVVTVLSLAGLTLLVVDRDGVYHILHFLLSVPVGSYDPDPWLFGCCGGLPPEGIPRS